MALEVIEMIRAELETTVPLYLILPGIGSEVDIYIAIKPGFRQHSVSTTKTDDCQ